MLKDLIVYVVEKLVDNPNEIRVTSSEENGTTVIHLTVAQEDLGKVIGKEGKVARTLRTMVYAAAMREGKKATVEIDR